MIPLLTENRDSIETLCRRFHVAKLEVFGSAARGGFDTARSDIDFLVELLPLDAVTHKRSFFGLQRELAALLGRKIDLVPTPAIRNRFFLQSVNESRQLLYAA